MKLKANLRNCISAPKTEDELEGEKYEQSVKGGYGLVRRVILALV